MAESLTELLNKVEAISRSGAGTYTQLAAFLKKPRQRVSEWVGQRTARPSGEVTLQIQNWAAIMTLKIAKCVTSPLARNYRKAFREVCKEHPIPGDGRE
jgi:hypothetical protein